MILLDTHIWVWWANDDPKLTDAHRRSIDAASLIGDGGVGVSVISCWEVAKLVEVGRLGLSQPVNAWIASALALPGVRLVALTPEIAVASTQLPPPFRRDPADQMLVATAWALGVRLVTADRKILDYPHVAAVG